MRKKLLILIMVISIIFTPLFLFAEEEKDPSFDLPGWLKRLDYGIFVEDDQKPRIYIETVQPLYQSPDQIDTFFTHDRISIQDERGTYSLGIGYRRLINDNLLFGTNHFFDYQDLRRHYRSGLGFELLSKKWEARVNNYFGLSPKRIVEELTSTSATYEKAIDGFDVELGGPIPYLPWCKIFASYYFYDFKKASDMEGYKIRSEIKPFKFITINLEAFDDNKGDLDYRLDTRFSLAFDDFSSKSIASAFKLAKEPYPDIDLKTRRLDRVQRNFNIQVERWNQTAGGTFEVGGRW